MVNKEYPTGCIKSQWSVLNKGKYILKVPEWIHWLSSYEPIVTVVHFKELFETNCHHIYPNVHYHAKCQLKKYQSYCRTISIFHSEINHQTTLKSVVRLKKQTLTVKHPAGK